MIQEAMPVKPRLPWYSCLIVKVCRDIKMYTLFMLN